MDLSLLLQEFLFNLNDLHLHLNMSMPAMQAPTFAVEQVGAGWDGEEGAGAVGEGGREEGVWGEEGVGGGGRPHGTCGVAPTSPHSQKAVDDMSHECQLAQRLWRTPSTRMPPRLRSFAPLSSPPTNP